jgi:16S rRNA (cytidine1402-2'-O)-methyltransferase
VALHRHNEKAMADKVIEWLAAGQCVALITDAGTPGVSDPGAIVAAAVRAAGHRVTPIPGPSALAAALSVAGFDDPGVLFCGFLPASPGARRKAIAALADHPYTLVFYEAPHRVLECVADLAEALGERRIVFARELTKLFESVHECALQDALGWLKGDDNRTRGEFVLLVSGARAAEDSSDWERTLETLLAELPLAQAVRLTCALTGAKRKAVYERALELNAGANDAAS